MPSITEDNDSDLRIDLLTAGVGLTLLWGVDAWFSSVPALPGAPALVVAALVGVLVGGVTVLFVYRFGYFWPGLVVGLVGALLATAFLRHQGGVALPEAAYDVAYLVFLWTTVVGLFSLRGSKAGTSA